MKGFMILSLSIALVLVFVLPAVAQEDPTQKIIKQGLVGAATGAIASEVSGGKAGKGALVGAGTSVVGGALIDVLTKPSESGSQAGQPSQVTANEVYQIGYQKGYQDGFDAGFRQGSSAQ